ncbi:MAG TPA: hypothetical protein VIJ01_16715 [Candidatus Angelobacter sp.]
MKRVLLFAICYLPIALFAQTSQTGSDYIGKRVQLTLSNAPQPVTNASVFVSGNPGPATYYYWIVTQTSLGASSPAGPFQAGNAPNVLSGSNFVQISWATAPGGATYDVLRTSNTGPPFGACNCAVATAVAGNSVNDQSNALNSYTVNTLDPSTLTVTLQNQNGTLTTSPFGLILRKIAGRTCYADQYPGADAGAKMIAAEADTNCSSVDATGFTGPQTGTSTVTATVPLTVGAYTYTSSANPAMVVGNQSAIIGLGMNNTIVTSSSNTADVVRALSTSQRFTIHDLTVQQPVTRTAGAALRMSGGNASIYNISIPIYFDGMFFDTAITSGGNMVNNFWLGNAVDSGSPHCGLRIGGVSSGTVASNQFANGEILTSATHTDADICVQDGADTQLFTNVQAIWDSVHSSVALHTEVVNGGTEPFGINFVNSVFEGGPSANSVVIDKVRAFTCIDCNEATGLKGVVINGGVTTGLAKFMWLGGVIENNQQHGVDIEAGIGDINIIGVRFADNGKQTNNTFDHIFNVGAGNFHFDQNFFGSILSSGAPANTVKWDIENAASACTNYTMTGNNFNTSGASGTLSDGCTGTNRFSTNLGSSTPTIFPLLGIQLPEGTNPTAVGLNTICNPNTSTHQLECANNGGSFFRMTQTIGTGTVTTAGTAVAAGTCQAQTGITVTGATTSDSGNASLNVALPATWQTGINWNNVQITANTCTISLCNGTAASITPAATAVRCTVTR